MAGANRCGPVGGDNNQPVVDFGTKALNATPTPGTCDSDDERLFEAAVDALKAEIANASFVLIWDPAVRARYEQLAKEYRAETIAQVRQGKLTWGEAAKDASELRNNVMELLRRRSSPIGRSWAEWMKPEGRTLNEMIARKTVASFGPQADFTRLTPGQQEAVYAAIVESAGKSNKVVNIWMKRAGRAGRGLLVLSVAISVYTVATADNKVEAAAHEGAVFGAGIAGGIAGGALAGLACGPGAPVCVTLGAFVGGALAAIGTDYFWK
jgi:hypothetical protein